MWSMITAMSGIVNGGSGRTTVITSKLPESAGMSSTGVLAVRTSATIGASFSHDGGNFHVADAHAAPSVASTPRQIGL